MTAGEDRPALSLYRRTASAAAEQVIRGYSTSFGAATGMLPPRCRSGVRSIYALVRIADEIVDGAAEEAGLGAGQVRAELDLLERQTVAATANGYSSNPVVHAFAEVARTAGIGAELTGPFFASMRADIDTAEYGAAAHEEYVYGSAEVVGLMCLQVFLTGADPAPAQRDRLVDGARALGRAFQNVNFLRDLAADRDGLGRDYLGEGRAFGEAEKAEWQGRIRADLETAAASIPLLPADCRAAVAAAHGLFAALLHRIERVSAARLQRARIRVPDPVKLGIALRARLRHPRGAAARPGASG